MKICYRIIDRRTTSGDPYRFPGKEDEYTERTNVVLLVLGQDENITPSIAEMIFKEFLQRTTQIP